jgi:hypothetical protein
MAETDEVIASFLARWQGVTGPERANYQLFLSELAAALDLPAPEPAEADAAANAYCFERRVAFRHGDGSENYGYIDLYRRGAFVLEAKDVKAPEGRRYDDAMLRARAQAEAYARALPAAEGRPPFVVVVDVGHTIELYSEFSRSGATYTPFPDPRSHRLPIASLARPEVRERLRQVWLDPLALDPSRQSAKVTREIAGRLARLARALEEAGHAPKDVAGFLTRCLFTFFAEDVDLLPKGSFENLVRHTVANPRQFVPLLAELWRAMNEGSFSAAIRSDLLRFNGKLFKDQQVLPLDADQIDLLLEAAHARWDQVEPAIFGTLLERALDPRERHRLGAHYTPRAYVERLVLPTIIEPLREEWKTAQAAALTLMEEGNAKGAVAEVRAFQNRLCGVRVLDPACGSGNFLYVTLEHLKRLEGEVLNQLEELGEKQVRLEVAGLTVDPHQFLGLEINPRAAAIAELVLWIGYLQWHFRTRGHVMPEQPVLRDFRNIEHRDAVLAYDRVEYVTDERGVPVTRWDGRTMKEHPVTGEEVPDESVRVPVERYVNPGKAEWPEADFVVGNPPFIGSKLMRSALGDGYVDALQAAWPEVPQATDFVMRWWHHAADLTRQGRLERFGLITTNTLRQTYVRRAVEPHLQGNPPLSLVFAVPDHPWVEASDGAAVRIAMTVGRVGQHPGRLLIVAEERDSPSEAEYDLVARFSEWRGIIHADLTVGVDTTRARSLQANEALCSVGMKTIGSAFQVTEEEARGLGLATVPGLECHIRPYLNGRDLAHSPRNLYVIDFYGLEEHKIRERYPRAYQHLLLAAKPERDQNRNAIFRRFWWVIGHPRPQFRAAVLGLERYIATIETSKHRFFTFLPATTVPDSTLVTFALDDAVALGVLSSRVHVTWALATGGRLGVGNDPRYNKTRCFETFPFPALTDAQAARIRALAEDLDAHRKRQQAAHETLTLTGMYNVVEKLRSGEPLKPKERAIHEQGLVSILKQLHDELDLAVLEAYGWQVLAPLMEAVNGNAPPASAGAADRDEAIRALDEALLDRLVALNAERAAEERRGVVRWLRPDFQRPESAPVTAQEEIDLGEAATAAVPAADRRPWPKGLTEQVQAVTAALAAAGAPLTEPELAAHFTARGPWRRRLGNILEMVVTLGRVRREGATYRAIVNSP